MSFIFNHEDFLKAIEEALAEIRRTAPEDREALIARLEVIDLEYKTGELPAREARPWSISKIVVPDWAPDNELGLNLCEIEAYYCTRL